MTTDTHRHPLVSGVESPTLSDVDGIHRTLAELRQAAARLTDAASSARSGDVPAVIGQLEGALKELSMTCYALGPALANEAIAEGAPLTPAQREQSLAALHEIGAAVGSAARICRTGRRALAARR